MDSILQETYQEIIKKIPEARRDTIVEILLDPDTHLRNLMNLFESGNTKKSTVHGMREELKDMINYFGVSTAFAEPNAVTERDDGKKPRAIGDFAAKMDRRTEAIIVTMVADDMKHQFIFPKTTIMNYYADHPIPGRFAVATVCGTLMKSACNLRWVKRKDKLQTIACDATTETITDVYTTPSPIGTKDWHFEVTGDDSSINNIYANDIRFIAFAYAFDQALKECVKGEHYTDLYRAICFGAA